MFWAVSNAQRNSLENTKSTVVSFCEPALIGVDVSAAILEHLSEFSWGRWVSFTMKRLSKAEQQQIWSHFACLPNSYHCQETPWTFGTETLKIHQQKQDIHASLSVSEQWLHFGWLCRQNTWTLQVSGSSLIRVSQEPTFLPLTQLPRKHMMSSVNSKNCASGRFALFKD